MEYFKDDIIKMIVKRIGTPLKLDRTTTIVERGKFARAAVEIDLEKPLVSMVWVQNRMQRIEYKALHIVYFDCGSVGHRASGCTAKNVTENAGSEYTCEKEKNMEVEAGMFKMLFEAKYREGVLRPNQ